LEYSMILNIHGKNHFDLKYVSMILKSFMLFLYFAIMPIVKF